MVTLSRTGYGNIFKANDPSGLRYLFEHNPLTGLWDVSRLVNNEKHLVKGGLPDQRTAEKYVVKRIHKTLQARRRRFTLKVRKAQAAAGVNGVAEPKE